MKNLITTLTMICIFMHAMSQDKSKSQVIFKDGDRNKTIEKIVFTNQQGAKVGEFDVKSNNPYSRIISSGIQEERDTRTKYYKTSGQKVSGIMNNTAKVKHAEYLNENVERIGNDVRLLTNRSEEVKGLVNVLYLYNRDNMMVGAKGNFQLLDEKGRVKKEIEVNTDIRSTAISNDGEYLSFNYGGIVDHYDSQIFDEGFSLYDTKTGQEILNIVSRDEGYVKPPFMREHLIIFKIDGGRSVKYYVIDTNNKYHYSKLFTRNEIFKLKKITTSGFEFEGGILENYEQSFTKTSF